MLLGVLTLLSRRQQSISQQQPWRYFLSIRSYQNRMLITMDKVYLRNQSDSDELHISFRYVNEAANLDRNFNFCRRMTERVDDILTRIRGNVSKEFQKKQSKKQNKQKHQPQHQPQQQQQKGSNNDESTNLEINVNLFRGHNINEPLTDVTFAELLLPNHSDDLKLRILDKKFDIVFNHPWILNLQLPSIILAGFLLYPTKMELQFATREHSIGKWYRAIVPSHNDISKITNWFHCGDGLSYQVTDEDIGHHIKFELTPRNDRGIDGPKLEHISKLAVKSGPGICPFELRQNAATSQQLQNNPNEIRVVSYNLLADLYADSDYSRKTLFPYCPPNALEIDYRKQLFIKELIGYNADLLCLQEVDLKIFDLDLKFILDNGGFHGVIAPKGTCAEGVATFYRKSRFELLETFTLHLGDNIAKLPIFKTLWDQIKSNECLAKRICDRSTTLQISLLKLKNTNGYILVANTHLYFHPDADHIRLLQAGLSLIYLNEIYQQTIKNYNIIDEETVGIIFCGDFNSVPECGIYKLMTEQFVAKDFIDWSSNTKEAVENVELRQPFKMYSACGTPEFTNFTTLFSGCLDYIFCQSDRFELLQSVPLPTNDQLTQNIAIPSIVFPSDHVALIADIKFKTLQQ